VQRVLGYIDGFNLYYGLKARKWQRYYWLDPYRLVASGLGTGSELVAVKYFTARVKRPDDKRGRQTAFLDAIRAYSDAEVILGKYYEKPQWCLKCGARWKTHEEKMTDSAIAAHLVADAFLDRYDTAHLVGGDTDIVPAVKMVRRHFPAKRLIVFFPPKRKNQAVADVCHDEAVVGRDDLEACQMPDRIEVQSGVFVQRPATWA
jgi:uncharacterized LabA/DUF88 family protein